MKKCYWYFSPITSKVKTSCRREPSRALQVELEIERARYCPLCGDPIEFEKGEEDDQ